MTRSDYTWAEEATTSGLYPTGWMLVKLVNCIKFNSEKAIVTIALLLLRLESK
ncbi:hypothetical protein NG796_12335 [Laspinema sp. A4]|uniref:hypothetical protein n=1 Tax=Laspinema sp. D2d TaxID=2953686 RepID=UPI0021BB596F|nr:hypothetical protein [Laspinema sp. D2d]MCT7984085.1 hypothetical protein [Laspinema sp. D2d]